MVKDLRALVWLTAALMRRLLREGRVVRSLVFPTVIGVGTTLLTISLLAYGNTRPTIVAITSALADNAELVEDLERNELEILVVDDPGHAVLWGEAWTGSDGELVFVRGTGNRSLDFEGIVRRHTGKSWVSEFKIFRDNSGLGKAPTRVTVAMLSLLFSLYGVVFGAGSLIRDRDEGTLEVELSMPVSFWVHGAARWLAGSLSICLFYAFSVLLFDATMGVDGAAATIRHGIGASTAGTAVGVMVGARASRDTGFSGPLAVGLVLVTGMFAAGMAVPSVRAWMPLASLLSSAQGWEVLGVSLALGALASWFYGRSASP